MPRGTFQCPHPCGESLPTHASIGGPPTLAGSFGSVSYGVTAPLLWVLVHAKFYLCLPRLESLFPSVLWKAYNQNHWSSRSDSLGIPNPFVRSPSWEAWCGVQNLHNSARTSLALLFSRLWVTYPADMEFDFTVIGPSYHLAAASSLSLDMGYLFLVGSSILPSMAVQQLVAVLVLSQEEVSSHPSTLPFWTRTDSYVFFSRYC